MKQAKRGTYKHLNKVKTQNKGALKNFFLLQSYKLSQDGQSISPLFLIRHAASSRPPEKRL